MRFSSRVLFSHSDWLKFSNHTIHIQAPFMRSKFEAIGRQWKGNDSQATHFTILNLIQGYRWTFIELSATYWLRVGLRLTGCFQCSTCLYIHSFCFFFVFVCDKKKLQLNAIFSAAFELFWFLRFTSLRQLWISLVSLSRNFNCY